MARRLAVVVALLVVAACGTSADPVDPPAQQAEPSPEVFCNVWPNARDDLLASWNNDSESDEGSWAIRLEEAVARYDRIVPSALRADWDRAHTVFTDIADLRFTVGYNDSRIRPEHLAAVFGEAGPDAAIARAESAIDNIDLWAATSCGDFCTRWSDLEEAVQFDPGLSREAMMHISESADRRELWIGIGDQLAPAAVAAQWRTAASIQMAYLEMLRDRDVAVDYTDEETEIARFSEVLGQAPDRAAERSHRSLDAIREWVERNCGAAALITTGTGPGRLSVQLTPEPSLTRSRILLALLPDGDEFGSVRSIKDYVAGSCGQIEASQQHEGFELFEGSGWSVDEVAALFEQGHEPREIAAEMGIDLRDFLHEWRLDRFGIDANELADRLESGAPFYELAESMGFDPLEALTSTEGPQDQFMTLQPINEDTEYSDHACQFVWEQEAILEPGDYELFVGAYNGEPGDWRFFVAAPTACATTPVTIGGDTTIEMPPLGPCPIGAVGSEREIARRSPPPGIGDGSLQVRLSTPHSGDFPHGCRLQMAILPAGTTLNDVGRGDTWPSGGISVGRPPLEHMEPGTAALPVAVPVMAYPAASGLPDLHIDLRPDGSWMGSALDPVALRSGQYDLHIEQACFQQPDDDEDADRSCAMMTVDVAGATVVDLPELGECP